MLFVIAGSVSTIATSRRSSARSSAATSLNGTMTVPSTVSAGTPRSSGTSRPSASSSTRASSKWPWYLPSNMSTRSRPVTTRATRIASVLACVAALVYCHFGSPNRRPSSSETTMASSVGRRNWLPRATCSLTARTSGSGAYPQNIDRSAMLKSA